MYEYEAKVLRVVDGDTLDAEVDLGFRMYAKLRFRLAGIDTPEIRGPERPEGLKAKARAEELLVQADGPIRICTEKAGKYGRWLAWILIPADGETINLNERLLAEGFAKPYGS